MKPRTLLVAGLAIVIACTAVIAFVVWRQVALAAKIERAARLVEARNQIHPVTPLVIEPAPQPVPKASVTNSSERTVRLDPVKPARPIRTINPGGADQPSPFQISPVLPTDPAEKEQLGRYALSFVGADPAADEVWASLIYDPSLSEKVREDLMEDLNENGFSDGNGRRATANDLPLIERRLALLEEHMPAADEFMLPHLSEAYKDLVNMWVRLARQ